MEPVSVLAFTAVALTLVVVPGPDWAYVLAAGSRDRVVAPAVAGIATGYALLTLVVVMGVGAVVANAPWVLTALTVAGAGYLAYLGVRTLRSARAAGTVGGAAPLASSRLGYLGRGVGVSALNPKGLLLVLSVLPQFTGHQGWPLPAQLALLGGVFVALTACFYAVLGRVADRVVGARPALARLTTRLAGVAMVVVGIALLGERVVVR